MPISDIYISFISEFYVKDPPYVNKKYGNPCLKFCSFGLKGRVHVFYVENMSCSFEFGTQKYKKSKKSLF